MGVEAAGEDVISLESCRQVEPVNGYSKAHVEELGSLHYLTVYLQEIGPFEYFECPTNRRSEVKAQMKHKTRSLAKGEVARVDDGAIDGFRVLIYNVNQSRIQGNLRLWR